MLSSDENSQDSVRQRRKRYIKRRLNFGHSILNLNTTNESKSSHINDNFNKSDVQRIPITQKRDFVRKWIEIHKNRDACKLSSNQFSSVSGISLTERSKASLSSSKQEFKVQEVTDNNITNRQLNKSVQKASPILGTWKYQNKQISDTKNTDTKSTINCSTLLLTNKSIQSKENIEDMRNIRRKLLTPSRKYPTMNCWKSSANRSPVYTALPHFCEGRRRWSSFDNSKTNLVNIQKTNARHKPAHLNMNSVSFSEDLVGTALQKQYSDTFVSFRIKLETDLYKNCVSTEQETPDMFNDTISPPVSPISDTQLIIENSPRDSKDSPKIDITSSNGSTKKQKDMYINRDSSDTESDMMKDTDSKHSKDICINNDSTDTLSDMIEDASRKHNKDVYITNDSSDTLSEIVDIDGDDKTLPLEELPHQQSARTVGDFDMTFFSQAEANRSTSSVLPNTCTSEKISEVTSGTNDSISSRTLIDISNTTSSPKINIAPSVSLHIIDSCKKKRKTKKGSMAAKLQSLVSRQASFVRIWQHQVKQAEIERTSVPHVIVYVYKCSMHFHRQFLEGVVIEDTSNLLDDYFDFRKSNSKFSRAITIMLIPDIVGTINMKSEGTLKIYPPWEIIDDEKTVLNVTYISISTNEQNNIIKHPVSRNDRNHTIKAFNCSCIKANRKVSFCREHDEKPDVMEQIFKF